MQLKDQVWAAAAPTAELQTIASRHRTHLENPEVFANTVKAYLSR